MLSDIFLAIFYGFLEGVTEFIPVSSTGHLILLADLLKDSEERIKTFLIFIQGGAVLAALLYYQRRFISFLKFQAGNNFSGFPGLFKLLIACFPASFLGLLLHDFIKRELFSPIYIAIALIVGAIAFLFISTNLFSIKKAGQELENLTYKQAIIAGCFQCLALWPGFSRSGSIMIGGTIAGLSLKAASDFSFILGVPILSMAALYDLLKSLDILNFGDIPFFAAGFISAFVFAYFSIAFFLGILKKYSLLPFAIYRIVLGLGIIFIYL